MLTITLGRRLPSMTKTLAMLPTNSPLVVEAVSTQGRWGLSHSRGSAASAMTLKFGLPARHIPIPALTTFRPSSAMMKIRKHSTQVNNDGLNAVSEIIAVNVAHPMAIYAAQKRLDLIVAPALIDAQIVPNWDDRLVRTTYANHTIYTLKLTRGLMFVDFLFRIATLKDVLGSEQRLTSTQLHYVLMAAHTESELQDVIRVLGTLHHVYS